MSDENNVQGLDYRRQCESNFNRSKFRKSSSFPGYYYIAVDKRSPLFGDLADEGIDFVNAFRIDYRKEF